MSRRLASALVLLLAMALMAACGDDEPAGDPAATAVATSPAAASPSATTEPTPSPPTPEPSPRPTVARELSDSFREFVREEVAPALAAADLGFFDLRAVTEHIVCVPDNTPSRPGGPNCQTVGDEFDGFVRGFVQSEIWVVPLEDAMASIQRLWDARSTGAADQFGDSSPRVDAIGVPPAAWIIDDGHSSLIENRPYYAVVLTAIVDRPEELTGSYPDTLRATVVLHWTPEGNGYVLTAITSGIAKPAESLLEFGPELWPLWEPYSP